MVVPTMTAMQEAPPTRSHSLNAKDRTPAAEIVELPLLLPRWQADALEDAANRNGMTTGQMIRRVIADVIGRQTAHA